jgi:hypothetical protein
MLLAVIAAFCIITGADMMKERINPSMEIVTEKKEKQTNLGPKYFLETERVQISKNGEEKTKKREIRISRKEYEEAVVGNEYGKESGKSVLIIYVLLLIIFIVALTNYGQPFINLK